MSVVGVEHTEHYIHSVNNRHLNLASTANALQSARRHQKYLKEQGYYYYYYYYYDYYYYYY